MSKTLQKKTVLVTGICGSSYGAQISKSLSLLKWKYNIIGADCCLKPYSDDIKIDCFGILPRATDEDYLDALMSLYKNKNAEFLIEGSESEQRRLHANRNFLDSNRINWISNSSEVIDICTNKNNLVSFLEKHAFQFPKIYFSEENDLDHIMYPLVLKPNISSGGSKNVFIAQNKEDIKSIVQLYKIKISDFCIQEYIGSCDSEYTVGTLHNNIGKFIASATLKRDFSNALSIKTKVDNITTRKDLGDFLLISSGFSQGTVMKHKAIENYCREIAEKMGSKGPMNFQGRLLNGKFYIFEINPRFSGTSFMRALSGINEADLWIENINKKDVIVREIKEEQSFFRVVKEIQK